VTASLPPAYGATRDALHRVAAHVLARRRADVTGRIGLRATPGGVGTPAFGDEVEVLRTSGAVLVRERAGHASAVPMTTLADLAAAAGVDLGGPLDIGHDPPPLGDPDAPLGIDAASARALGDWFALVTETLDGLGAADPSAVQIWPEHFDAACDVAWGSGAGERANLGGSPGDGFHAEPYLYVGPWGPERPGDPEYWNAPFGAILPHARLRESWDARREAAAFLRRGLDLLSGRETE
jgi:hypothetical protein